MPSALATPEKLVLLSAGAMVANAINGSPTATAAAPILNFNCRLVLSIARGIEPPPTFGRPKDVLQRTSLHYSFFVSPSTANYALHQKISEAPRLAPHPAELVGDPVVA